MKGPLFIVGCACSGTTLVRLMFDAHPALHIPEESHFMYQVFRGAARASLQGEHGWSRVQSLVQDSPWLERWALDHAALRERMARVAPGDFAGLLAAPLEQASAQAGARAWGDKTPQHVQYLLILARIYPRARFLHVIRDGRAVATSLLRHPWGPSNLLMAGYYWTWLVLSGLVAGHMLGPNRYAELRYEQVVQDPESQLRPLCNWLGLDWDPAMLKYFETASASRLAARGPHGRRTARPLQLSPLTRWQGELGPLQRGLIGQAAAPLLGHLGYPVELSRAARHARDDMGRAVAEARWPQHHGVPGPWGLRRVRLFQGLSLVLRRYRAWARGSVAWQSGVCARLGLEPGRDP